MTNNDELERQAFQNWWRTQRKACQFARMGNANGKYHSKPVQQSWEAWQARAKQESNHD
jgi:hypothetical protein